MIDPDDPVAVRELPAGTGGLNPNVAVRVDVSRDLVDRLVLHVQLQEAVISQPAEQCVAERDEVVIVQHRELDVTDTAPPHHASTEVNYYIM